MWHLSIMHTRLPGYFKSTLDHLQHLMQCESCANTCDTVSFRNRGRKKTRSVQRQFLKTFSTQGWWNPQMGNSRMWLEVGWVAMCVLQWTKDKRLVLSFSSGGPKSHQSVVQTLSLSGRLAFSLLPGRLFNWGLGSALR